MLEILLNTRLDREQRSLLDVLILSGDLVLQLINDILDLSKVESGVMKLEATKFRPTEVVKHVLQTAAASLQKILTSEGHIADDVPIEQPEGHVGIKLYVIPEPPFAQEELHQKSIANQSTTNAAIWENHHQSTTSHTSISDQKGFHGNDNEPVTPVNCGNSMDGDSEEQPPQVPETTVWIRCDVYGTGIENILPIPFKQVSADHARKYGGTGLGLAICKHLIYDNKEDLYIYSFPEPNFGCVFSSSSRSDHLSTKADSARSMARARPAALFWHSRCSSSGSLSATIPAPA
ncbi:hypothetical protein QYF36_002455 [Acer negundo]|nr:hypothetical protein QYF36_001795 [Acer negundo]KAK4840207.1 hypothetical protein QYF36_002455 [Acer negundo]